ncbi:amino acid transporter heavy chain SLC3A1 [Amia ocellicauda]|uniref:amino acid transporter heavy chain SLC3A1 n=1 Tax=Amia ocellicauda TaxID=2972642 RepID=UPI0034639648
MSSDESNGVIEMKEGIANAGFEDGQDGDAGADIYEEVVEPGAAHPQPYAGMPKEVLLLYSGQARYRLPREILFWLTVLSTLALVVVTATVIALSPRCLSWWQASPVYQVYPRSFQDSDNDGIGDLKGIQSRLDHFEYLNVKAVWISPFFKSPMKDFGYDVEDFREIDPIFGTMEDFENLLAAMHDQGLKLIMDFIPNHTSDQHEWFKLSRNRTEPYTDYFIWHDCQNTSLGTVPPNNWVSVFGNSAWQYDAERQQCYLHQFLKEQPELNFRHPDVRREITDVIRFWLEKGVDGLRIDAAKHILEAKHLRDEPQVNPEQPPENVTAYWQLHHDYTTTQLGTHEIIQEWRAVMDEYSREPGRYRFLMTDSYDGGEIEKSMMYYGTPLVKEADFPFNFYLVELLDAMSGNGAFSLVNTWLSNMPKGRWPNWVIGNHDMTRLSSRAGKAYVNVLNMLLLTLPGTPSTYYGEEIGMENVNVTESEIQDPLGKFNVSMNRDPGRSPMQWSSDDNASFSKNKTWLPVHPDYKTVNVETQKNASWSTLRQYRALSLLRTAEPPLHRGWMCLVWSDNNTFAFLRELDGFPAAFLVVLNFGAAATVDLSSALPGVPPQLRLRMSTHHPGSGQLVSLGQVRTETGEGLVLEYAAGHPVHSHPAFQDQCYVSEKACYLSTMGILHSNC